jgi:hypothetical protein
MMNSALKGARRARRAVLLMLSFLVAPAAPVLAHGATSGSPPLVPETAALKHRRAEEIIALFAREELPTAARGSIPRAARAGSQGSLLPSGIDAVLRASEGGAVVLVGTAGLAEMRECIEVLDAPVQTKGPDRQRIVLALRHADPLTVRDSVLRLPEAGSVTISGGKLVLEGRPEWVHRSLRQVIREELNEREPPDLLP